MFGALGFNSSSYLIGRWQYVSNICNVMLLYFIKLAYFNLFGLQKPVTQFLQGYSAQEKKTLTTGHELE